ncbi:hypothetical protein DUNSADRAFT_9585 [Dunaliella salina]|uniref:Aminotransferase class I/classII large domain-containing protein n=1 Tax=Dunaliella salina TaxID=3046 RepID=A0ABQ7GH45_DUNSA|nr:hypothetical protein DUNSADRAFT_9585 [Dunaliella salina]|eukprot:KAF5833926.1 hypothetical protein DUNSADRAFT_9585 [Dunaliella salina]
MQQSSPPSSPLPPFELERFFAKHEFSAPYLACCSDCEPLTLQQLVQFGDDRESEANLGRILGVTLGYTETQGLPALRKAIVDFYHGPSVQPEDVCICVPEEGVYLTMRVLLRPGDHVVCTFPGYQSLYSIAASIGCSVSKWEPEMSSAPAFRVEKLQELVESAPTRLVVVNFPHKWVCSSHFV